MIAWQVERGARLWRRSQLAAQSFIQAFAERWRFHNRPGFSELIEKVSDRAEIHSAEVLPYISQESRKERVWVNLKLAEAYFGIGNNAQAKVFIQRVWEFSGLNEKYLELFISIHAACDDIDSIRAAHKALAMKKANAGNIGSALQHFNAWQNAYAIHRKEDDYRYDFEVLDRIARLAEPFAYRQQASLPAVGRKIRLAYLIFGIAHANSVIVKISLLFAKYHDPSRFEIKFYVPEQAASVLAHPEAVESIGRIRECGWDVVTAPDTLIHEESLIGLSQSIHDWHPDMLVTTAGLADFNHYFISALRPAPLVIGLCQGPPPQFIAPDFDWSISWFKSLLVDCPTDCSLVPLRLELPVRSLARETAKSSMGIPPEMRVIMVSGREFKLKDEGFLCSLLELLESHSGAWLVVVGINQLPPSVANTLSAEVSQRIVLLGWVRDFHQTLSAADVVIDTYPSGGGVVIKDAMALGTPVVSFKNDYMKQFSQKECSAAEEVIGMPELLLERGDFVSLKKVVSRLLMDDLYRNDLSKKCIERILETSGHPELMIRDCEKIYARVLNSRFRNRFDAKGNIND
jgi:predicted O-linked N-acetylglucosamine transferase (SPINDLY family)